MRLRRTSTSRRAMTAVALLTALAFSLAGCGGSGGGGGGGDGSGGGKPSASSGAQAAGGAGSRPSASPSASASQPLATVTGNGVTLAVTSARRDQGGFVTVSGTVTNNSGKFWIAADWKGDERELSVNGASLAGASLVDAQGKKKYLVLRDTQGHCLCTKFDGGGVQAGQTTDWYAQFPAPPQGSDKVTFQVGAMPPASIQLTEGG
ncbi:hypothetical protein [Streptomyces beihaiensis]|uniref:Lipoprotein n=1 Tax=Streptomyces beihaiensis TaxID=2984495 RepID=A0ABT3TSQ9_9ACTN|nr:hypothetical protein [Streptomyces beihaiensis]MCX3060083.1 hypothetical protein [Streptomyces beihaiensis]